MFMTRKNMVMMLGVLVLVMAGDLWSSHYQVEEDPNNWTQTCQLFDPYDTPTTCDPNMVSYCDPNTDPNITGNCALMLRGSQTTINYYEATLSISSGTKYKISYSVKIEDRNCYDHTGLGYPDWFYDGDSDDYWCGRYQIRMSEDPNISIWRKARLEQPHYEASCISYAETEWFYEEGYYLTSPNAVDITLTIRLEGFDGKLYIDALTVEEVNDHIDDKYLRIPISYEYEGMKIVEVDANVPSVETKAAKFIFDPNSIVLKKKVTIR